MPTILNWSTISISMMRSWNTPQSGERIRGRRNIQITRTNQPNKKRFTVRRVVGSGDLWITEYILTYDGKPSYTVSIMEFSGDKVARETQYFADPFEASTWRAQWVERMGYHSAPGTQAITSVSTVG
jgi:hypothetical protein